MGFAVTEHLLETPRHTTFYLACGAADAPPIIFVHGWPELSLSWRHQLPCFASLGFRAIAPDMRGYGRSSVYRRHEDYALEHAVADMLELLASLGREQAVWVGHDWGAPVVWSLASHHPERCIAVANLCVPYFANGFCPENVLPYVDARHLPRGGVTRSGSGTTVLHYEENFDATMRAFDADLRATVRVNCSQGQPRRIGQAVAAGVDPPRRQLVRRGRPRARRAARHRRAERSRTSTSTPARCSATASSAPTPGT